ncbi:excalibur calcium-binding domain-containing protein [Streptomyces composti]|uniref:excalibur calcium-binding domain-containing protein n=1 Tax=Streptomyces composti TaxID=2720025 RepID=UPI0019D16485|nr:excalibur calcium-binding domain-containing protein [Streptomyces composti]
MNPIRTSARASAAVLAALALAAVPATAVAHDGNHPFANCTDAYNNGYSNIPEGDEHYAKRLDRDGDGIGCDKPPAGFKPRGDQGESEGSGTGAKESSGTGAEGGSGTDLAETGGNDATPYIAGAGAVVVLAGGGLLIAARKRRDAR